jgi:Protein of unknown function (DUF1257)
MSHLTSIETRFQKLTYLKKALTKLKIPYNPKQLEEKHNPAGVLRNLTIPQSNGHDLEFAWNGNIYQFVVDLSFWAQPYRLETFLEKLTENYAMESVIGESKKLGFQVVHSEKNSEEGTTLRLERWNENHLKIY